MSRAPSLCTFTGALIAAAMVQALGCAAPRPKTLPPTLRALYGLASPASFVARRTALLLVDFQQEFFAGRLPLAGGQQAVEQAAALRAWARANRILIVHVRNVVPRPDSLLFAEGSPTVALVPELEPMPDELVVTKRQAGAFSKTELDSMLRARGIDTLIVAGLMTHLAVDSTVRDGAVLGYRVLVASDGCATRALPSPTGGAPIPAAEVHRVALASLADRFADVRSTAAILRIAVSK